MVLFMSVDEFIEKKVLPKYRDIVSLLREVMREMAPDSKLTIYYGIPMFKRKNLVLAWISPTKKGITFGFRQGVEFEDKYGLLEGKGKWARNIRIKNAASVDKEALRYYIKQALELESKINPT